MRPAALSPHRSPRRLILRQVLRARRLSVPACVHLAMEVARHRELETGSPRRLESVSDRSLFITADGGVAAGYSAALSWSSPEELRGFTTDERTDVFTIGRLLFHALHGEPVFEGESDLATMQQAVAGDFPPLQRPDVPTELAECVLRALAVEPANRFPTGQALVNALRPFHTESGRVELLAIASQDATTEMDPAVAGRSADEDVTRGRLTTDDARLVYADELEEAGRTTEAAWLREEIVARTSSGQAKVDAAKRLRALEVPVEFVTDVSVDPIETCGVSFGFVCPRTWSSLQRTSDPRVRFCGACAEPVHFVSDVPTARAYALRDQCIVFAPGVEWTEADVEVNGVVGRPIPRADRKRR